MLLKCFGSEEVWVGVVVIGLKGLMWERTSMKDVNGAFQSSFLLEYQPVKSGTFDFSLSPQSRQLA
jgi:hypothetical protein